MSKEQQKIKTLRLLMPQWQGGYDESAFPQQIYPLGARLLAWLAPQSDAPLVEVPIEPYTKPLPSKKGGVFYQQEILRQIKAAQNIIDEHKPDRIITFGGDCLISQAPFAYLNVHYHGQVGLIWIDAHPDVTTPNEFDHAHAMVLGNLLGEGDPIMAQEVKKWFTPEQVLLVGVDGVLHHEQKTIDRLGIKTIPSQEIMKRSDAVTQWIQHQGFERVVIHFDLDVLNPDFFRSLLLNNPNVQEHIQTERGKTRLQDITLLLQDISAQSQVVGMSFAEYMPWDALNLKNMLNELSFMH